MSCLCGRSTPESRFRYQLCEQCAREARHRENALRRAKGIPPGRCLRCRERPANRHDVACSTCLAGQSADPAEILPILG